MKEPALNSVTSSESVRVNDDFKKKLIESLRDTARSIGTVRFFWEEFAERLCRGEVKHIDPLNHLKSHDKIENIQLRLHQLIDPTRDYKEIAPEQKIFYAKIIKIVADSLQY